MLEKWDGTSAVNKVKVNRWQLLQADAHGTTKKPL